MSSLHLSAGDIIRNISSVPGTTGHHIIFSPEFQNEIRTTRKSPISIQLKKEFPYQEFTSDKYRFLNESISRLTRYIDDTSVTDRSATS